MVNILIFFRAICFVSLQSAICDYDRIRCVHWSRSLQILHPLNGSMLSATPSSPVALSVEVIDRGAIRSTLSFEIDGKSWLEQYVRDRNVLTTYLPWSVRGATVLSVEVRSFYCNQNDVGQNCSTEDERVCVSVNISEKEIQVGPTYLIPSISIVSPPNNSRFVFLHEADLKSKKIPFPEIVVEISSRGFALGPGTGFIQVKAANCNFSEISSRLVDPNGAVDAYPLLEHCGFLEIGCHRLIISLVEETSILSITELPRADLVVCFDTLDSNRLTQQQIPEIRILHPLSGAIFSEEPMYCWGNVSIGYTGLALGGWSEKSGTPVSKRSCTLHLDYLGQEARTGGRSSSGIDVWDYANRCRRIETAKDTDTASDGDLLNRQQVSDLCQLVVRASISGCAAGLRGGAVRATIDDTVVWDGPISSCIFLWPITGLPAGRHLLSISYIAPGPADADPCATAASIFEVRGVDGAHPVWALGLDGVPLAAAAAKVEIIHPPHGAVLGAGHRAAVVVQADGVSIGAGAGALLVRVDGRRAAVSYGGGDVSIGLPAGLSSGAHYVSVSVLSPDGVEAPPARIHCFRIDPVRWPTAAAAEAAPAEATPTRDRDRQHAAGSVPRESIGARLRFEYALPSYTASTAHPLRNAAKPDHQAGLTVTQQLTRDATGFRHLYVPAGCAIAGSKPGRPGMASLARDATQDAAPSLPPGPTGRIRASMRRRGRGGDRRRGGTAATQPSCGPSAHPGRSSAGESPQLRRNHIRSESPTTFRDNACALRPESGTRVRAYARAPVRTRALSDLGSIAVWSSVLTSWAGTAGVLPLPRRRRRARWSVMETETGGRERGVRATWAWRVRARPWTLGGGGWRVLVSRCGRATDRVCAWGGLAGCRTGARVGAGGPAVHPPGLWVPTPAPHPRPPVERRTQAHASAYLIPSPPHQFIVSRPDPRFLSAVAMSAVANLAPPMPPPMPPGCLAFSPGQYNPPSPVSTARATRGQNMHPPADYWRERTPSGARGGRWGNRLLDVGACLLACLLADRVLLLNWTLPVPVHHLAASPLQWFPSPAMLRTFAAAKANGAGGDGWTDIPDLSVAWKRAERRRRRAGLRGDGRGAGAQCGGVAGKGDGIVSSLLRGRVVSLCVSSASLLRCISAAPTMSPISCDHTRPRRWPTPRPRPAPAPRTRSPSAAQSCSAAPQQVRARDADGSGGPAPARSR